VNWAFPSLAMGISEIINEFAGVWFPFGKDVFWTHLLELDYDIFFAELGKIV